MPLKFHAMNNCSPMETVTDITARQMANLSTHNDIFFRLNSVCWYSGAMAWGLSHRPKVTKNSSQKLLLHEQTKVIVKYSRANLGRSTHCLIPGAATRYFFPWNNSCNPKWESAYEWSNKQQSLPSLVDQNNLQQEAAYINWHLLWHLILQLYKLSSFHKNMSIQYIWCNDVKYVMGEKCKQLHPKA